MGGYIGARAGTLSTTVANVQDVTATDTTPEVTIVNSTHEDTDGGREGKVIFKGQQSGGEESTLAEIQASHDGTADDEKGDLIFKTNDGSDGASPTEALRIDSEQNLGLGTNSPDVRLHVTDSQEQLTLSEGGSKGATFDYRSSTGNLNIATNGIDARANPQMTLDLNGKVLVGKTSSGISSVGAELRNGDANYAILGTSSAHTAFIANRTTSDGEIFQFRKDNTAVGSIGNIGTGIYIAAPTNGGAALLFSDNANVIYPSKNNSGTVAVVDDYVDLGASALRFDDVFATNGTIQTSDENEKQDIASLTSAEITAATAISKLFKTFKWKDKVAAKGDNARTHTGVVAQQVQTAMSDAGLDASKYAFWCSDTWWTKDVEVAAVEADEEKDIEAKDAYTRTDYYYTADEAPEGATEHTRMGIRYPELLSFVGAATEQRLTSIEDRLDALEAE